MEQQEVLDKLGEAAKAAGKAFLVELIKDGGAFDAELEILAKGSDVAKVIVEAVKPLSKQVLKQLIDKI